MTSTGTAFDISTQDPALAGTHLITLRAYVVNPDTTQVENTDFSFEVTIIPPDCADAVLTCPTTPLALTYGLFTPTLVHTFAEVPDSITTLTAAYVTDYCGPKVYSAPPMNDPYLVVDSTAKTLSVLTTDLSLVG